MYKVSVISLGGLPGSGTTTIGEIISNRTGFRLYNMGYIFREMAKERGLTLLEFADFVRNNLEIDREIDRRQLELASLGNIILEGRVSGFVLFKNHIPSFKVWLMAPSEVRFKRISEREGIPYEEAEHSTLSRERGEAERYMINYGFDIADTSFYDLVIQNYGAPPSKIAELILKRFALFSFGQQQY